MAQLLFFFRQWYCKARQRDGSAVYWKQESSIFTVIPLYPHNIQSGKNEVNVVCIHKVRIIRNTWRACALPTAMLSQLFFIILSCLTRSFSYSLTFFCLLGSRRVV